MFFSQLFSINMFLKNLITASLGRTTSPQVPAGRQCRVAGESAREPVCHTGRLSTGQVAPGPLVLLWKAGVGMFPCISRVGGKAGQVFGHLSEHLLQGQPPVTLKCGKAVPALHSGLLFVNCD